MWKKAAESISNANDIRKTLYDKKYKTIVYKANKKVKLNSPATKPGSTTKLYIRNDIWKGPYTIKKVFKNGYVQLDIGKNKTYVVHQNRIKKAEEVWENSKKCEDKTETKTNTNKQVQFNNEIEDIAQENPRNGSNYNLRKKPRKQYN
jgi:hypothetical protein